MLQEQGWAVPQRPWPVKGVLAARQANAREGVLEPGRSRSRLSSTLLLRACRSVSGNSAAELQA